MTARAKAERDAINRESEAALRWYDQATEAAATEAWRRYMRGEGGALTLCYRTTEHGGGALYVRNEIEPTPDGYAIALPELSRAMQLPALIAHVWESLRGVPCLPVSA